MNPGNQKNKASLMVVLIALLTGFLGGIGGSFFFFSRQIFPKIDERVAKSMRQRYGDFRDSLRDEILEVRGVVVSDMEGNTRAELGIDVEDDSTVFLLRKNDDSYVSMTVKDKTVRMELVDDKSRLLTQSGLLMLSKKDMKTSITISNLGAVRLSNDQKCTEINPGLVRFQQTDPGSLTLDDGEKVDWPRSKDRLTIALLTDDRVPSINFLDQDGNSRMTLGYTKLTDLESGETIIRPEASIVMFDKDKKVKWEIPK